MNDYLFSDFDKNLTNILENGIQMPNDRTGVGCKFLYGLNCNIDISERVPILTKRKVAWKSIVKEILWIISGSDKISDLESMGSNIWTPWINNDFTAKYGLEKTSIGYGYGPNLRNFGGDIGTTQGFDQLQYVINSLRENPTSRQILFTLWRPDKLNQVLLPACHHTYQFITEPDENGEWKKLNCVMFQRSCDYPIGVGMGNLLGGTIFTRLIAQQVGMKPEKLIHMGGHCHIYSNALEQAKEYLERSELPSPKMNIKKCNNILDYTINDFELTDYVAHPSIKMPIAV